MIDATSIRGSSISERYISRPQGGPYPSDDGPRSLSDRHVRVQYAPAPGFLGATMRAAEVRRRVRPLLNLQRGWDSYGAPAIDPGIIETAEGLLLRIAQHGLELPSVVPTSIGGVSLEWHRPGIEISIEFSRWGLRSDPRAVVFFADDESDEEWEHDLADVDPAQLDGAFARLSSD